MISILRHQTYEALSERLREIVAADPSIAPLQRLLLLPVQLLESVAVEVEGTLGDDPLAGERVRLLLSGAGAHAISSVAASALSSNSPAKRRDRESSGFSVHDGVEGSSSFATGIIDVGALVVVALAAGRAGAAVGLGSQFVTTVLGLALASGPAEAIAGPGGRGLTPRQLSVLLSALSGADTRPTPLALAVGSFLAEPFQRARWSYLNELLSHVSTQVVDAVWCSATGEGIVAVESIANGEAVRISMSPSVTADTWSGIEDSSVRVVFASGGGAPVLPASIIDVNREHGVVDVVVPERALPGWVGLDDSRVLERVNATRRDMRAAWRRMNAEHPCLVDGPVPIHAIRDLSGHATPPVTTMNRFHGGARVTHGASRDRESREPSEATRLVVIVRPAVFLPPSPGASSFGFMRIGEEEMRLAIREAERLTGVRVHAFEPAWIDDAELSVYGPLGSPDAPGAALLIDRLSAMSASHAGLEDALWIALVPRADGGESFLARVTAEAAQSVVVATPEKVVEALSISTPPAQPPTLRLRLAGSLRRDGSIRLAVARTEIRCRAAGAPIDTGVMAVALDREGGEIVAAQVRTARACLPSGFAVLLPISSDVVTIELRRRNEILYRLTRPAGALGLDRAELVGDVVRWAPRAPHSPVRRVTVEVGDGQRWSPVLDLGSDLVEATVPYQRIRPARSLRVVASDGWNTDAVVTEGVLPFPRRRVAVRHGGGNRFWADTEDGGEVRWLFNRQSIGERDARMVELPPVAHGTLVLTVNQDGEPYTDARSIGGPHA